MPHVSPGRFSAKTDFEDKVYGLDWANEIGTATIIEALWSSYPNGLQFANQNIAGSVTSVSISGGIAKQPYRVRCQVTLDTGEKLEASEGNQPGIPLEVLGFDVSVPSAGTWREDYGRSPY